MKNCKTIIKRRWHPPGPQRGPGASGGISEHFYKGKLSYFGKEVEGLREGEFRLPAGVDMPPPGQETNYKKTVK